MQVNALQAALGTAMGAASRKSGALSAVGGRMKAMGFEMSVGPVADQRGVTDVLYGHAYGLFDEANDEWSPDHKGAGLEWRCRCGWTRPDAMDDWIELDHSYHVAGVLKETFDIQAREYD